jgi:hypothetical protein
LPGPLEILNTISNRCKSLGIECIEVAEIDIEYSPKVHYKDLNTFLDKIGRRAREVYYRKLPQDEPEEDPDFEDEYDYGIDEILFFFLHNGVCNVLEVLDDGTVEF